MDRSCSCHISPPCSYCLESWECALCIEIEHPDEGGELFDETENSDQEFMCSRCCRKVEACA